MKLGLTISSAGHAALLAWGLISFAPKPFEPVMAESLPVDVISSSEFTQITAGSKTAKTIEKAPKPVVDKVGERKDPKDLTPKVTDKPEITAAAEKPPAPKPPEVKPPEPKPEPKPDAKKEPEPKVDPIAEALKKQEDAKKKEEAKKQEEAKKLEEAKKKEEAKKREEAKKQEKLDFSKIENKLALLDKREARRQAATGDTLNQTASLGLPTGRAATLSQSEIDALRAQIQACWSPPVGVADAKDLNVEIRLMLRQDGSVAADPQILNRSPNPLFQVAAESARRAILRCQPYRLPAAKYDVWKDVEVNFDPRDMFRG
jgi:colicin import membrane protein